MEWHTPMCYTDSVKGCRRRLFFVQAGRHETSCLRFSLLGQAAVCKQQLLVGTSFAAFASGWIRKLTCSAVPPLQSKPTALGFALVTGEGDARLRPEWRQGLRKDRAANPVFSDITFKRRGRLLPSAAEPLPPPSEKEAWEPPSPSALLPPPSGREAQSLSQPCG